MDKSPDAKGFLIDGFPRNIEQGPQFEEAVRKIHTNRYQQCNCLLFCIGSSM